MHARRRVASLALALSFLVVLAIPRVQAAPAPADCQLAYEFQQLASAIPDVAGACLEDPHRNPSSGDTVQATTGGLFVQRDYDGVVAFTDGATTWEWSGCGVVRRSNTARFNWEVTRTPNCHIPLESVPPPFFVLQPTPVPITGSATLAGLPPELSAAWDLLHSPAAASGDMNFAQLVDEDVSVSGVTISVGDVGPGAFAAYRPSTNTLTIAPDAASDSPAAVAAVLIHELTHAHQRALGSLTRASCVGDEVEAYRSEILWWQAIEGKAGVANPGTDLQKQENFLLATYLEGKEPALYTLIVNQPGYQEECELVA